MTANVKTASGLTPAQQNRRDDILVLVLVAIALIAGWFVKSAFQYATTTHDLVIDTGDASLGEVKLGLPTTWAAQSAPITGTVKYALPVTFRDPGAGSSYKTTIAVDVRLLENTPTDPVQTLQDYVDRAVQGHTKDLVGYQLLSEPSETQVNGALAWKIEYAYVSRPIDAQLRNALPVVVRAVDYIVLKANHVYLVTETVDAQLYSGDAARVLQTAVDSLQFP